LRIACAVNGYQAGHVGFKMNFDRCGGNADRSPSTTSCCIAGGSGLDNAGKTTILKRFNDEDIDTISPTVRLLAHAQPAIWWAEASVGALSLDLVAHAPLPSYRRLPSWHPCSSSNCVHTREYSSVYPCVRSHAMAHPHAHAHAHARSRTCTWFGTHNSQLATRNSQHACTTRTPRVTRTFIYQRGRQLGFNIKTLEHRGYKLNFWDVGGQKSLRS
jgi:GTPase SAR1 family protein